MGQGLSEEIFMAKLSSNAYKSIGTAKTGIAKSSLSSRVKKKLKLAAEQHFDNTVEKPRATAKKDKKNTSFLVTFARHAGDVDKKRDQLNLLRGAADAGMTLPDLVKAYEEV